jgi:hypothetical protein
MRLEIVQKARPVEWQLVLLKIPHRKREPVINADNRRNVFGQSINEPFGDSPACPVFARTWWWFHLDWYGRLTCREDPKPV